MSILVLTPLCVYVHYNALGLYIKLFALYKNIFLMKIIKTENRFKPGFQQPKSGFPKNPVLTSLILTTLNRPFSPWLCIDHQDLCRSFETAARYIQMSCAPRSLEGTLPITYMDQNVGQSKNNELATEDRKNFKTSENKKRWQLIKH